MNAVHVWSWGEKLKHETDLTECDALKLKMTLQSATNLFKCQKQKPDNCFLTCFDCQKNLPLPKVSDQSAYNSRQLLLLQHVSCKRRINRSYRSENGINIYVDRK